MKEEIDMDKLIKLLNEYAHTDFVEYKDWCFNEKFMWEAWMWYSDVEVISKDFWFIQWLVDNNKINWSKYGYSIEYTKSRKGLLPLHKTIKRWDSIIMLLSIKEKPLEFLVSILKQDE